MRDALICVRVPCNTCSCIKTATAVNVTVKLWLILVRILKFAQTQTHQIKIQEWRQRSDCYWIYDVWVEWQKWPLKLQDDGSLCRKSISEPFFRYLKRKHCLKHENEWSVSWNRLENSSWMYRNCLLSLLISLFSPWDKFAMHNYNLLIVIAKLWSGEFWAHFFFISLSLSRLCCVTATTH